MSIEVVFRYLLNFLLALFIILILYFYYSDEISSFIAWINIIVGVILRTILVELINQKNEWITRITLTIISMTLHIYEYI